LESVTEQTRFKSRLVEVVEEKAEGGGGLVERAKDVVFGDKEEPTVKPPVIDYPVDQEFQILHQLMDPSNPRNEIVIIMEHYYSLYEMVDGILDNPASGARQIAGTVLMQKSGPLPEALNKIQRSLTTFDPKTREELFEKPIHYVWASILNQAQRSLNSLWRAEVYDKFEKGMAGYYPFSCKNLTDIPISDVERYFQRDNGTFWSFYNEKLRQFISRDSWYPYTWEKRGIRLSSHTRLAFRQASRITDGLFAGGSLRVDFSLQPDLPAANPESPRQYVERVCLSIDGKEECYQMGMPRWKNFAWPGEFGASEARLEVQTKAGSFKPLYYAGDWAWFRLLEQADIYQEAQALYRLNWSFPYDSPWEVQIKYKLRSSSQQNPFGDIRNFFKFQCPERLD
jgi:type VI protein secretion system component VasK